MKTHFNTPLDEYDRLRGGHQGRRRYEIVRQTLRAQVPLRRVAEIGFGTGRVLNGLAGEFESTEFWGTEISDQMVAFAASRAKGRNARFVQGAPASLITEVGACAFDAVFSLDVIHHVREHREFFETVFELLRPGGRWLAVEPNIWNPYIWAHQEWMRRSGFDEDHFRPWVLEPLLRESGFLIAEKHPAFLFPAFVQSVPRIAERLERRLERTPFLGGSICYTLERPAGGQ